MWRTFGLLIACCVAPATTLPAAEPAREAVGQMLTAAERNDPAALAAVQQHGAQLRKALPNDPRADYACALALVGLSRAGDALPLLERYLGQKPDDLPAARTRIWAELQLKRNAAALAHCEALAGRLAAAPPNASVNEAVEFLGTAIGYLDLQPGDEQTRQAAKNRILAILGKRHLESFDTGRKVVLDRVAEFQAEQEAREQRELAKREARHSQTAAALDQSRAHVAKSDQLVQSGVENVRDAERQFEVLRGQLTSLQRDRALLTTRITILQSRLMELQTDGQGRRGSLGQFPIDTASLMTSTAISLASLNRQAFDMDRRILALQAKVGEVTQQGTQGSETVASGEESLRKAEKKANALEKQLLQIEREKAKPATKFMPQMRMLKNYLPNPLAAERDRVAAWF
jgi:predicted  nucleic acid-binding Zn-ribbon protein